MVILPPVPGSRRWLSDSPLPPTSRPPFGDRPEQRVIARRVGAEVGRRGAPSRTRRPSCSWDRRRWASHSSGEDRFGVRGTRMDGAPFDDSSKVTDAGSSLSTMRTRSSSSAQLLWGTSRSTCGGRSGTSPWAYTPPESRIETGSPQIDSSSGAARRGCPATARRGSTRGRAAVAAPRVSRGRPSRDRPMRRWCGPSRPGRRRCRTGGERCRPGGGSCRRPPGRCARSGRGRRRRRLDRRSRTSRRGAGDEPVVLAGHRTTTRFAADRNSECSLSSIRSLACPRRSSVRRS